MKIKAIEAREILDSRGNPTVATTVELWDGVMVEASVPSGASTGSGEAYELRDYDQNRYGGLGVLKAVNNVNTLIGPALIGQNALEQAKIDGQMRKLDGTENKSKLGANAILSVSLAVARAAAVSERRELFEYLSLLFGKKGKKFFLPTPMFNVINGGAHAENNLDIQEMMLVPTGLKTFNKKLEAGSEIEHRLKTELKNKGYSVGLGDEGGFAPEFSGNEAAIKALEEAIKDSGYKENVNISLDVAATEFFRDGKYFLRAEKKEYSSEEFIALLKKWQKKYHLFSIEDGLSEGDSNWKKLTKTLGQTVAVGDDLFTTNPERIELGAKEKIASGVIIKPNQIGTLTETLEAIKKAQEGNLVVIVSHRSGETEDSFLADLAVGVGAPFIKAGAPARSERLAKYNRLTKIEELLELN